MAKCAEESNHAKEESGLIKAMESTRLVSNQYYILAVESALQGGLGVNLQTFSVNKPPTALTFTQK
eukprot:14594069-Heterocapsa_arctica.AAC.1